MIALAKKPIMSVDDYIAWSLAKDSPRADLIDGVVYLQASERVIHIRLKLRAVIALEAAIKKAALGCHALGDGALVRITNKTAFEPDALVYCGPELSGDAVEVPNPVIVVEVLSPDSKKRDTQDKVVGYFLVPSIRHYLIVDPEPQLVIHHTRGGDVGGKRLSKDSKLELDPPGFAVHVGDFFL